MNEKMFYLIPSNALDSNDALVKSIQDIYENHVKCHGDTTAIYVDFYPLEKQHNLKHLCHKALVKDIFGEYRVYFDAVTPSQTDMLSINHNRRVYDNNIIGLNAPSIDIERLLDATPVSKE